MTLAKASLTLGRDPGRERSCVTPASVIGFGGSSSGPHEYNTSTGIMAWIDEIFDGEELPEFIYFLGNSDLSNSLMERM